jgi:molybdopterin biosynthesis enzyme
VTIKNPTTVAELIAALRQFPPETRVMVDGYEAGYDDPVTPHLITVAVLPKNEESTVYGAYEEGRDFPAVLIARPGR